MERLLYSSPRPAAFRFGISNCRSRTIIPSSLSNSATLRRTGLQQKCRGLGEYAAMDWRPALDEVLLMSSVLLAYLAGVVNPTSRRHLASSLDATKLLPAIDGHRQVKQQHRQVKEQHQVDDVWSAVNRKLRSVTASVPEAPLTAPFLCLHALEYGARLRLLTVASQVLENELKTRNLDPLAPFSDWICSLIARTCKTWVLTEPLQEHDKSTLDGLNRLKGEAFTIRVESEAQAYLAKLLERSGKLTLYSDVICFFQTKRPKAGSRFDAETCSSLAETVIEDLIVVLSEGAAAMYLGAFSASSMGWSTMLRKSISSTRSLESFQNQVALRQWAQHNFESVAAIYEDRMQFWRFEVKDPEKREKCRSRSKFSRVHGGAGLALELTLVDFRIRRTEELKALAGWRYYYSLYLECSDIVAPVVRILLTRIGQAVSFLFVSLIGRSFGLIYQGIRDSIKWSG